MLAGARAILTRHDRMGSDSVLQRQGPALGDAFHDKGRGEALYARQRGNRHRAVESPKIARDDTQEIVGITKQPLGLKNIRDLSDRFFEHLEGAAVCGAHRDEDQSFEVRPRAWASSWAR